MKSRYWILVLINLFVFKHLVLAQPISKFDTNIILIPLDDRPPCLQFPVKMGLIGNIQIMNPPKNILGNFNEPGQSEKISQWIMQQDLSKTDAIIISLDMLAFGGLVNSRVFRNTEYQAVSRMNILKEIKVKYPGTKIYGSSVQMRLAPTADGKNEVWREKVNKWAGLPRDEKSKAEVLRLEKEIPSEVLMGYKKTRARNFDINCLAVELVHEKILDFLIVGQDDATPKGIHISEKDSLKKLNSKWNLSEKIILQAGADEASMLLLARFQIDKAGISPKIKLFFSSVKTANQVMPFEDKPLKETVSSHLKATGCVEVADEKIADLAFFVFASRLEKGRAGTFVNEISKFHTLNPEKGIVLVDIDPVCDIQGGDPEFTELALSKKLFSDCYGYASWNTAANAIGTALSQGVVHWASKLKTNRTLQAKEELKDAQAWFVRHRLVDDYLFHSLIRPGLKKDINENEWNPLNLTGKQVVSLESAGLERLEEAARQMIEKFPQGKKYGISKLSFILPWKRTFEAEIDFVLRN